MPKYNNRKSIGIQRNIWRRKKTSFLCFRSLNQSIINVLWRTNFRIRFFHGLEYHSSIKNIIEKWKNNTFNDPSTVFRNIFFVRQNSFNGRRSSGVFGHPRRSRNFFHEVFFLIFGNNKLKLLFFLYFSLDAPCPQNYNPADYYIHLLSITAEREESSKQAIKMICDTYEKSEIGLEIEETASRMVQNNI